MTEKSKELNNLIEAIHILDAHQNKVNQRDEAKSALQAAHHAASQLRDFRRQLSDIYRDPDEVFEKFATLCMTEGVESAVALFNSDPESPGPLKGWSLGPLNGSARNVILKLSLPIALKTGSSALTNHLAAGGGDYSQNQVKERLVKLEQQVNELTEAAGASGERIELELRVAEAGKNVTLDEIDLLPPEQGKLVEDLIHKFRPLLVERAAKAQAAKLKSRSKKTSTLETAKDDYVAAQQKDPSQVGKEAPLPVEKKVAAQDGEDDLSAISVDDEYDVEEFDITEPVN